MGFSLRRSTLGGTAISYGHIEYSKGGGPNGQYDAASINPVISSTEIGAWITWNYYCKASTSDSANDGAIKWGKNGVWLDQLTNVDLHFNNVRGWENGYLMGWHNTGYTNNTLFDLDEIEFDTTEPSWASGM